MFKNTFLLGFILFFSFISKAQFTDVGQGGFILENTGPIVSDSSASAYYSRMAYIYPAASLSGLEHGDSIEALSFRSDNSDSLRGVSNMKIYIKSTSQADFGLGSLNWLAETRNNMELVYDNDPTNAIGGVPQYVAFIFDNNKKFAWDTTGGKVNLEILIEFTQQAKQVAPISWYVDNSATVNGFVSQDEGKFLFGPDTAGMDSISFRNDMTKPTLRIHHPESNNDLVAQNIYALGTVPLLMGQADSIKMAVFNTNGSEVINRKAYINVSGANTFFDSTVIPSVLPYQRAFAYFDSYIPVNQGVDTITLTLASDGVDSNNVISKNVVVSYNIYSHSDPFGSSNGGIGFTGSTGDFVAKFYVNGESYINQITVDFASDNVPFQVGIWDDDGPNGSPGTEIFISDTNLTALGSYIVPVLPRVKVEDGYFVGIRQSSGDAVGFSFQFERPVRPDVFYFLSPAGATNTSWTPFSPGFDFNINITPRLQVANDLGVLSVESPQENDTFLLSLTDSIPLSATFINYGFADQSGAQVNYDIVNQNGQTVFSGSELISLNTGDSITIDFGKFSLFNLGDFTATVSIDLGIDSVLDNNSQTINFVLVRNNDVGVNRIFSPTANDTFELNREYFFPVVSVTNFGSNRQDSIPVFCEIVNPVGDILSVVSDVVSIDGNNSLLVNLDSLNLTEEGNLFLRSYTLLGNDSFPQNDTMMTPLISVKVEDMQITNIPIPENQTNYEKGVDITPLVDFENDGRLSYDSVYFYATLYGADGSILYRDTNITASLSFSTGQIGFSSINLDSLGDFRFFVEVFVPGDQQRDNDTLNSYFSVITANDLKIVKLISPDTVNTASNNNMEVLFLVENQGLRDAIGANFSLEIVDDQNNVILSENKNFDISSLSEDTLSFSVIDYSLVGEYSISLINNWNDEDEPNQFDTFNSTFIIGYGHDVSIQTHQNPSNMDTVEWAQVVSPEVVLANGGLFATEESMLELKVTNPIGDVVLQDTLLVDSIDTNGLTVLNTTKDFVANAKGTYIIESRLIDQIDDVNTNDSFTSSFEVVIRRDILISNTLNPVNSEDVPVGNILRPEVELFNNGLYDIEDVETFCRVYVNGLSIYDDTRLLDIDSGETVVVTFDSTLQSEDVAEARLEFICKALDDQISTNDTLNVLFSFTQELSVSSISTNTSKVYPNPFKTSINVVSKSPIQAVKIYDIKGRLVFGEDYNNSLNENISLDLSQGTYSIEVLTENRTEYHTIIKSN